MTGPGQGGGTPPDPYFTGMDGAARTADTGTREEFPSAPLLALDTLWFQVAGTLCNLECRHCFISCSPANRSLAMMTLDQVAGYLAEAEALGVKEYYFTGGEPFLHPDLLRILEVTLRQGPATVLTNGTLLTEAVCRRLRDLDAASENGLDLRISLDGADAAANDAIRGAGSFARSLRGVERLAAAGLNPAITVTEACPEAESMAGRARLLDFLRGLGLERPRLKILPLLRLGAEEGRTRAYAAWETLRGRELGPGDAERLQCATSRMATAAGVYVCPILVDFPAARLAPTLADSLRPFPLRHRACSTCWETGFSCRT